MFDTKKLKNIPESPGVYLMKNADKDIIYVGKAKNLKKRVSQYFTNRKSGIKTELLVSKIDDIETIVSVNELDAFLLENNLIKKYKPRYNISLKDDKSYPFIKIAKSKSGFPFIFKTRNFKKGEGEYFGPYSSSFAVTQTIQTINKIFKLRTCSESKYNIHRSKTRPCLYYQINRCSAPCAGLITVSGYDKLLNDAKMLLKGKNRLLLKELKKEMERHVKELNFEAAIKTRDKINGIIAINEKQVAVLKNEKDIDVISFYRVGDKADIVVLVIRGGKVVGTNSFFLKNIHIEDSEMLSSFMDRYYTKSADIYGKTPDEILIASEIEMNSDDKTVFLSYIKSVYKKDIRIKQIDASNNLMSMSLENAKKNFNERVLNMAEEIDNANLNTNANANTNTNVNTNISENTIIKPLVILKEKLNLNGTPKIIECFDISNISGTYAVASKSVFNNGQKDSSLYRRYKIMSKNTPDDYAMMFEALTRRFNNAGDGSDPLPNIIMVDGGKGQLNVLSEAAKDFKKKFSWGEADFPALIAIAKSKDTLKNKKKDIDKIYIPNRKNELNFGKNKETIFMLMRLRDEAHRFAVSYHSKLKRKSLISSELLKIDGVGAKTYNILINSLLSVEAVKKSSLESLLEIKGLNKKTAQNIYKYFHN